MTPDRTPPAPCPATCRPRFSRALLVTAAAVILAIAAPAPALAQPPTPDVSPEASAIASTDQLYSQGVAAVKREDWQAAYQNFLTAWKIKRQYQIGAQLARAELRLGKHRDAAEHLAALLAEFDEITQDDRALLRQMLAQARSRVVALLIKVNRDGAEILVDGVAVGLSPLAREVYVEPGKHLVEARLPGEASDKVPLDLTAGQSRQVGLTFGGANPDGDSPPCPQGEPCGSDAAGGPNKIVLIAGGAAAGVGLVMGTTFAILGATDPHRKDDKPTVAGWSLVGGVAFGAATLIYWLASTDDEPRQTAVRASPLIASDGGGVLVSGQW